MDILNNYFWEIPKLVKIQKKKIKAKKEKEEKVKEHQCLFFYVIST